VQCGEPHWVESPDGHRASLSLIKRKAALSGTRELYLVEIKMVLPDQAAIPVVRHEVPVDEITTPLDLEQPGEYIQWDERRHGFVFAAGDHRVEITVPF
jgi:hypothetical protein